MEESGPVDTKNGRELNSLAEYSFYHAETIPDRIAIMSDSEKVTYAELATRVRCLAVALLSMGLRRHDRICVLTTPRPDAFTLFLAANAIGVVWVAINPRYRYAEMKYVVSDAKPRALFYLAQFEGREYIDDVNKLQKEFENIESVVCIDRNNKSTPNLADLPQHDGFSIPDFTEYDPADDVAMFFYTSGSTGHPKACMVLNKSMINRSLTQIRQWPISDYMRVYNPLPMNHSGGMHFISSYSIVGGGTIYFAERFEAAEIPKLVERYRVNILLLAPAMYKMIIDTPTFGAEKFRSLEWLIFAGSAAPIGILRTLQRMCDRIGTCYGLSETCGSVTYSEPEIDIETLAITIGRSVPEGEIRVMNKDERSASEGEIGEIHVRPEFCMAGYFNRPEETAKAYTSDGWLKTGDLVEVLPKGNLRFVGRNSEMFKSGGYNVYPREIELTIEEHPNVALVAVIGVPDERFDEVGNAFIVPKAGADVDESMIRTWCRERLANYKVPKLIEICQELPMLPIGKIDKIELARRHSSASSHT